MASERLERRLAAILAADVAGYSRLMGSDEEGTLAALKALRKSLIDPKIVEHHGRIVKTTGDGALVEFASAVDGVRCATEIQRVMAAHNLDVPEDRRIEFRIGINVGDIIIDEGDIYGDGVNIAARIETLAAPGGICLSENAYQQIKGKLALEFGDMGEQKLKNISQSVRVFSIGGISAVASGSAPLALPDKPSIAVLPFQNMSGDSEQEYFADGVVEDIITALSRFRQLFVIARNSSFTYKGRAVDIKRVGRELGVRYVLEGSVRKASNRVRITGQLIETETGTHLWADRFDGALEDIFDLQDQVTASVVGAIAPELEQAEINRARRKPTNSLDAYDYYLRGIARHHDMPKEAQDEALRLFYSAIESDPNFALPYGAAAICFVRRLTHGWMTDRVRESTEAIRLARRGIELGKEDAVALANSSWPLAFFGGDLKEVGALLDQALILNANVATAWTFGGWVRLFLGEHDPAIERYSRALRLSPRDRFNYIVHTGAALAHLFANRFSEAAACADNAMREIQNFQPTLRAAAACYAMAGQADKAKKAMTRMLEIDPELNAGSLRQRLGPFRPDDIAKMAEALQKAGLPDEPSLALPDKPSIAVLAFQNMSGDLEQEYFSDGIVEDIITALSRFKNLFVIARNSSFTYKGRAVDVKRVGRELGVRYVLEGSVRKAANRVRITGQLIDTSTGTHLWADHFDGALEDIFDLQDRVTQSVVGAIAPKLEQAEIARAKRKPTDSLDAYDLYLRGLALYPHGTKENVLESLRLFRKAIERDPEFAAAYGLAAWAYVRLSTNGWIENRTRDIADATWLAQRAAELGKDDAVALSGAGWAMANFIGDLDRGAALMNRARTLNPNLASAWVGCGWISVRLGEPEVALEYTKHAMRLSPLDRLNYVIYGAMAAAHLFAGRYDEAASWAEKAEQESPNYATGPRIAAAGHALAGRLDEAHSAVARLLLIVPAARVSNLKDWITLRRPQDLARLEEGLRKAGLP